MLDYLKTRIEGTVRFTRRVMASFSRAWQRAACGCAVLLHLVFHVPADAVPGVYRQPVLPLRGLPAVVGRYLESFFPSARPIWRGSWNRPGRHAARSGPLPGSACCGAGLSIFSIMEISLSRSGDSSPRDFWRRRLLGALSVLALVVTFLASFSIGPFTNLLLESSGDGAR